MSLDNNGSKCFLDVRHELFSDIEFRQVRLEQIEERALKIPCEHLPSLDFLLLARELLESLEGLVFVDVLELIAYRCVELENNGGVA